MREWPRLRLPLSTSGDVASSFIARTASAASVLTRVVFCQSRGSLSVEEKTTLGARPIWAKLSFSSSETSSSSACAAMADISR